MQLIDPLADRIAAWLLRRSLRRAGKSDADIAAVFRYYKVES